MSTSPVEKMSHKISRDSMGRFKNKRTRFRGLSGDCTDESPSKVVRRRLLENDLPMKAVAGDQPRQEQRKPCAGTVVGLGTLRQFAN